MTPTYLGDADIAALDLRAEEIANAIEAALRDKAAGRLHVAPKSAAAPGNGRHVVSTLACGAHLTVFKAVSVNPDNPRHGLPSINGALMVLDAATGMLRAVLDANRITALRTAALTLVAARRLANPAARSVAFIGCGVQAQSHLAAVAAEYPLSEIRAFGRGADGRDRLIAAAQALGVRAVAPGTAEAAVRGADIVISAVALDRSIAPFLDAGWLSPGAFAAIADQAIPWRRDTFDAFDLIAVDDREQEAAGGNALVPADRIAVDLGDLVAAADPSFDPSKKTAFMFRGIALADYAAICLIARRLGWQ